MAELIDVSVLPAFGIRDALEVRLRFHDDGEYIRRHLLKYSPIGKRRKRIDGVLKHRIDEEQVKRLINTIPIPEQLTGVGHLIKGRALAWFQSRFHLVGKARSK